MTENERLLGSLSKLAALLLSDETLTSSLNKVANLSVQAMEPCDAAGVSVVDGSQVFTMASSDERAQVVDDIQYATKEGPCLQAIKDGAIHRIDSMEREARWPEFVELAGQVGVTACLALPMLEDGTSFGSLNLYSYGEHPFGAEDESEGIALAAQAAGTLANMRRYTDLQVVASRLEHEIASPTDVAIGILMERAGCSRGEAMESLRAMGEMDKGDIEVAAQRVIDSVGPSR